VCRDDHARRHGTYRPEYSFRGIGDLFAKYHLHFLELILAINAMKMQKGLALQDILGAVYEALQELDLCPQTRIAILDLLATIEHRLSMGATEKLQVSAMVAGIKSAIDLSAQ
jgi:Replication factor C C-terminal domain